MKLKRILQKLLRTNNVRRAWPVLVLCMMILCIGLMKNSPESTSQSEKNHGESKVGDPQDGLSLLLRQVSNKEKPLFVLNDFVHYSDGKMKIKTIRQRKISQEVTVIPHVPQHGRDRPWARIDKVEYPSLYNFQSYDELPAFSQPRCRSFEIGKRIPNLVHYIWFGKLEMTFLQYISVRSAATVQQPYRIVFHTDSGEPTGAYWNSLKAEVPCLVVEYLPKPTALFGKILTDVQQQSHIARLPLLFKEGGIYAGLNVIFVNPLDDLLDHSAVLGQEERNYYSNTVILAEKGAQFMSLWFKSYNRPIADFASYSLYIPWRLHTENPHITLHVEDFSMMRPNFKEDEWFTHMNWQLENNYCVHLYNNRNNIKMMVAKSPIESVNMDNTYGQLVRKALLGKLYLEDEEHSFRNQVHSSLNCSKRTSSQETIPNIVHYVLDEEEFHYKHYLSVRSAARVLKPRSIIIHVTSDKEPDNYYWIQMIKEIDCIAVERLPPTKTEDKYYRLREFVKLILVEKYGGILLSFDVIVTKPFTDLMNNSFVMDAKQSLLGEMYLAMSARNSEFLSQWLTWNPRDFIKIKSAVEKYASDQQTEKVTFLDDFPYVPEEGGLTFLNEYYKNRCFVINKSDPDINLVDVIEYDVLKSYTLSGQIARIAIFGTSDVIT